MTSKQWYVLLGIVLLTASGYWTTNQAATLNTKFWLGLLFTLAFPVGTYLTGLYQDKPGTKNGS